MLKIDLNKEINPLIVADAIGQTISNELRSDRISLYSAFLLNQDELKLRHLARRQPAWGVRLTLSDGLALYMQYLFGLAVGEANVAGATAKWIVTDLPGLGDGREHYIRKHLELVPANEPPKAYLVELSSIRSEYDHLSDDHGPYHTEVFPYDYFSPEDVLMGTAVNTFEKGEVEADVEDLFLSLSAWTFDKFGNLST